MVREYLEAILKDTEEQIEICQKQIEDHHEMRDSIENDINKIQMKGDLDVEYFSPRRGGQSLRNQLGDLYGKMEKLNKKLKELEETGAALKKERNLYQFMLDEVIDLEKRANVSRET